jgi:hypothetical protein
VNIKNSKNILGKKNINYTIKEQMRIYEGDDKTYEEKSIQV